jgi:HSP20 family protein
MMPRHGFKYIPKAHEHIRRQACNQRHIASNIIRTEQGFDIELAVPGIDKKNVMISVKDKFLTIESKTEQKDKGPDYNLKQFDYSNFIKRFELSDDIDTDKINARYTNGILTISLEKKDGSDSEIIRKINIK